MDPIESILDWFRRLVMGRIHGYQSRMMSKARGAQARVKGKVAGSVNKKLDAVGNKVTGKKPKS